MTGSIYAPQQWSEVQTVFVRASAIGFSDTCLAGHSKTLDFVATDDMLLRGIEFMADGVTFGDTLSISVIDTNGITGVPPGTTILTPVTNWRINSVSPSLHYESVTPQKLIATMTIRLCYTSTSLIGDVDFAMNLMMLKVLK